MSPQELEARVAKLEKKSSSPVAIGFQYLVGPAILLLLGFYFNRQIDDARRSFQELELEVRRIEATRGFLDELFSGTPQRAFVAERLMAKIVDRNLAAEISQIVEEYYAGQLDRSLATREFAQVEAIKAAAETIRSPASDKLRATLNESGYYVIVLSVPSKDNAVQKAEELRRRGFESSVLLSDAGNYRVALGRYPLERAKSEAAKAIATGIGPPDAWLINEGKAGRKVFPE